MSFRSRTSASPRRQSLKRKGPVPIGRVVLAAAERGSTITKAPKASDCSKPPERRLSDKRNVKGSSACAALIAPIRARCGFSESGPSARSSEYLAVSASKRAPS
jgi:hypothetical protein